MNRQTRFPLPLEYQKILTRIAELRQELKDRFAERDASVTNQLGYLVASDSLKLLQLMREREFHKLVRGLHNEI